MSLDAWAGLALAVLVVAAFHIYRPIDDPVYWCLWMVLAVIIGRVYYAGAHTVVSSSGVICFTFFRREQIQWCDVAKAEVLKNGNIALWTTTQRVVVPLAMLANRVRLSDFIVENIREMGAPIDQEQ